MWLDEDQLKYLEKGLEFYYIPYYRGGIAINEVSVNDIKTYSDFKEVRKNNIKHLLDII